jgi:hypothetical protein
MQSERACGGKVPKRDDLCGAQSPSIIWTILSLPTSVRRILTSRATSSIALGQLLRQSTPSYVHTYQTEQVDSHRSSNAAQRQVESVLQHEETLCGLSPDHLTM